VVRYNLALDNDGIGGGAKLGCPACAQDKDGKGCLVHLLWPQ
jgi:hypothetical protein